MDRQKPYTHNVAYTLQNGEAELLGEDSRINTACIKAIDEAVLACNYEQYRYKMSDAVKSAVEQFGFERVTWVLAGALQECNNDRRYSAQNKEWAKNFDVPKNDRVYFIFNTHPAVLDGFIDSVRKAHREMMTDTIGQYENSHRMADRNRLTWFHSDFGSFVLKDGVTDQRLFTRYNEIMEKKAEKQSVLAQIRASRKEQPPTDMKQKQKKKHQGEEL